jgi:hypothetical protein
MTVNLNARNEINTADTLLFDSDVFSRMRNGLNMTIPVSHSFRVLRHFNLSNSINYQARGYFSTIGRRWDPDALGGIGSVVTDTIRGFKTAHDFNYTSSVNTKVYGMVQFGDGPVRAVRHVLTPTVFVLHAA